MGTAESRGLSPANSRQSFWPPGIRHREGGRKDLPAGLALTIPPGEEKAPRALVRSGLGVYLLRGEEFPRQLLSGATNFGDWKTSRGEQDTDLA